MGRKKKSLNILEEISAKSEEARIKRNLLERVQKELEKDPVIIEKKVDWSALARSWCAPIGEFEQDGSGLSVDYDLSMVPTWALIEDLKNRPGVIFRANTTKEGLVGTFEHAPAMVFTVKLPVNDEV
jgi:hypothetical protein